MNRDLRFILKKATSSLGIQVFGMGFGYLFGILVARYYGAEAFGRLSLGISAIAIVSIASVLGMDRASVKLISTFQAHSDHRATLSYYKLITFIGVLLAVLVSVVFHLSVEWLSVTWYEKPELSDYLRYFTPGVIGLTMLAISSESLRGLKKIKSYSFFRLMSVQFLSTGIILIFSWLSLGGVSVILSYILSILISALISWGYTFRTIVNLETSSSNHDSEPSQVIVNQDINVKSILKLALPLALASSLAVIMSQVNLQLIGRYLSEMDAGLYAAAFKISMLSAIALKSVNSITSPQFAEAYSLKDFNKLRQTAHYATTLSFCVSLPVVVFCLVAPEFILSLYGKEFAMGARVLQILALGRLVASASGPTVNILQMTGLESHFQYIILSALAILVVLSTWWIPTYGLVGAAWSSFFAICWNNFTCLIVIKVKLGFWNFPSLKRSK